LGAARGIAWEQPPLPRPFLRFLYLPPYENMLFSIAAHFPAITLLIITGDWHE
jgi:hypothetical protein